MTVRVSRTFAFDASVERVWAFIADPKKRAEAISVVDSYEVEDDGVTVWRVKLPIPFVDSTVPVRTEEVARDPPYRVKFVGKSSALRVTGEHTVRETKNGCELVNEFVVDGRLPGVERYFKKNLDRELNNLERALRRDLELAA